MRKEKAIEMLESIKQLKDLKAKLMGWENADGYSLDAMIESYLKGVSDAEFTIH